MSVDKYFGHAEGSAQIVDCGSPVPKWRCRHQSNRAAQTRIGDWLDDPTYASQLSPSSIEMARDGYSRWLGFLDWGGELDPLVSPVDRITPYRITAYLKHMKELGNRDYTIVGRISELQSAVRIIAPEVDFGWLSRPGGTPLRSRLRMVKKSFDVPSPSFLYKWGLSLAETALALNGADRRRVQLRDGILIAILAARAPRLRSITGLRLGTQITRGEECYRIMLGEQDTKTGRPIEYDLPKSLNSHIDRYLKVERQELLNGKRHDSFFVNWNGNPLEYLGVRERVCWWTAKKFGKSFGPHRFRHAIGTAVAMADPAHPGIAAAIMGNTAKVVEKHYDRANSSFAAQAYHVTLAKERIDSKGMAERAFRAGPEALGFDIDGANAGKSDV